MPASGDRRARRGAEIGYTEIGNDDLLQSAGDHIHDENGQTALHHLNSLSLFCKFNIQSASHSEGAVAIGELF